MRIPQKIAIGLSSGLLIGSVASVLPTVQFWCFVIGLTLLNYVIITQKTNA
ncbi:hypothetical protein [Photobacterium toruni]|uniref:Uncharacterized protein n=1 Tax=Photobacterium toruni TaxID=1935446 RepID=A0A1T4U7Y5_9GAMM|nr:hypothetical protein [Photobacterium toruni]MEC6813782.1 hypothetical protein [Photobacterium toruni]MEC6830383.1 hypothetical protein [Photobacterium toruni]SKA48855.1 hypothetical protein CZ814_02837 [Photobacterium toruni]